MLCMISASINQFYIALYYPVFALWYLLVHTVPMVSVSDMINLLNAILTFISLIWDKQHR